MFPFPILTGFLYHKVDQKNEEIQSLKAEILQLQNKNPDNLVESNKLTKSSFYLNEM